MADEKSIMCNRSKLPETTKMVKIEGANHAQFGYYGFQLSDNSAKISMEEPKGSEIDLNLFPSQSCELVKLGRN